MRDNDEIVWRKEFFFKRINQAWGSLESDNLSAIYDGCSYKILFKEDPPRVKEMISKLEEYLNYHNLRYRNGEPLISDNRYDHVEGLLRVLDKDNKVLQKVGYLNEFD